MQEEAEGIAITGVGAVSGLGVGAATLHRRWLAGEAGIADGFAPAAGFEPADHMTVKEVRRSDRFTQLTVVAADEAIAHAGWADDLGGFEPSRVACLIGTGIGGLGTLETQFDVLRDRGARSLSPLGIPVLMPNAAAATLAMRYGTHGPAFATGSACAAGANAIGTGLQLLRAGAVDAAVVGGAESTLTPFAKGAFGGMGTLSETGVSRPFDARRDGFVMGEGAGVLVLERPDRARARGAEILGRLTGYATTVDAFHLTAPEPEGTYAALAVERALADAGLAPADVDYVNAHGTSTALNDIIEARALRRALGARADRVPVSSTKSAIGHLLGASGAVEAVATVLALRDGVAPPNLGYGEPDPEVGLNVVAGAPQPLPHRGGAPLTALSNSFGFGGHNAVLAFSQ